MIDPTQGELVADFVARCGTGTFPHSSDLLALLKQGKITRLMASPSAHSCEHFAQVYETRASMVTDRTMREEFAALSKALREAPDEPCRLWIFFADDDRHFSVFERPAAKRVAGCFVRTGFPGTQ